jgi:hypothetical protein
MSQENKEVNVYNKAEELEDNDEIETEEEGFMQGYNDDIDESKCANCHKVLEGTEFIEEEIKGKKYRFCSRKCADAFEIRQ